MLAEWRADWNLPNLPFGIIQLTAQKWATARLAQLAVTQTVANTFLVVTADLPNGSQLHPTAKYLVGIRTSIGARGLVYGEAIEYAGPIPAPVPATYTTGSTVVLTYLHAGNGLFTSTGGTPAPFAVAGSTGRYSAGNGMITSANTIQVLSSVAAPARIEYAVSGAGNVFNRVNIPIEGGKKFIDRLPGSLFRMPSK
jgi:sialate O-acetylesterase